jgi:hypothetical protein
MVRYVSFAHGGTQAKTSPESAELLSRVHGFGAAVLVS